MKRFLSLAISCLFANIMTSYAQNDYYYYRGNIVPLSVDSTKVVTLTSNVGVENITPVVGLNLLRTLTDNLLTVNVYEQGYNSNLDSGVECSLPNGYYKCYKNDVGEDLIPNGYINVKLNSPSDYEFLVSIAEQYNCTIVAQNQFMPLWYSLIVSPNSLYSPVDISNAIYETGQFASSFPSLTCDALEVSYDLNVYQQWGLYNSQYVGYDISISQAWNYATGRGIKIAIVDQGIDLNHQDLATNIYPLSYDTETGTSPSHTYGDHGTHCAGIAAAVRNNGIQVAGVAPDAKLMSVSTDFNSGNAVNKLANGINWAWSNGADIISCSWKCSRNELIEDAIDNAVTLGRQGKGCIFVKSAGNGGGLISFPGDYSPNVITVANMKNNGIRNDSSCHGSNLFVIAPGTNILSTVSNNQIDYKTGTSMAAPHVAGLAALILERNPSLSAVRVREIIARNAKKIGDKAYNTNKIYGTWNEYYGYGLIDAASAVINTPRN